jgi:hypothetical protein
MGEKMIVKINILVVILFVAINGCSSSQKRSIAQAESSCWKEAINQKPELGDYIFFREKQEIGRIRGQEPLIGKSESFGTWMNIFTKLNSGEKINIEQGMRLKVLGFGCTENNIPNCGDVILASDTGRRYYLNCGGSCGTEDYNLYFSSSPNCETIKIVPASAPAESVPTNAPVEI